MSRSAGHAAKRQKLSHTLESISSPRKQSNIRPSREDDIGSDQDFDADEADSSVQSDEDSGFREDDEELSDDVESRELDEDVSSEEDNAEERQHQDELRTLSFGALAEAQDALPSAKRRRSSEIVQDSEHKNSKLQSLRDRLAELREKKAGSKHAKPSKSSKQQSPDPEDHHRTSNHAPTEQSSKKQVTRRRPVVETSHLFTASSAPHKLQGDPRFNAASGSVDHEKIRKNYGFLKDIRQQELKELRSTLNEGKKRKRGRLTEEQEADLKREIVRRENRMKSEAQKDREREIASKHKREERERVKEGKTPFYLKRGQVKEQARKERWEELGKKGQEKSENKSRRRKEAKEMKRKPGERRVR